VLPLPLLRLAGRAAVEAAATGAPALDVARLRGAAKLVGWPSPAPPAVAAFWEVLEALAPRQQELVLRFVFARRRLPAGGGGAVLTIARMARDAPDGTLPVGHTCAGVLELPEYSSKEALRRALLKAAEEGLAYDTDGGSTGPAAS